MITIVEDLWRVLCSLKIQFTKTNRYKGGIILSASTITINGKTVRLSLPVVIPESGIVGREVEMNKVLACWLKCDDDIPLSPLLIGAPGVGKNKIVYASSRICASELYIFQGHEDITAEDLFGSVRISDDREQQMDYIMSPLVTAMIRGGICFIDEIGKIRARALAPLASLLDERRYLAFQPAGRKNPCPSRISINCRYKYVGYGTKPPPGFPCLPDAAGHHHWLSGPQGGRHHYYTAFFRTSQRPLCRLSRLVLDSLEEMLQG